MPAAVQVVIDALDPERLAGFWAAALGYTKDWTWDEETVTWMRDGGLPEEMVGARAAISDPDGQRPRLYFQRVPEPKLTKNRVHLDVHVGPAAIDAEAERLCGLGATRLRDFTEPFGPLPAQRTVVMADPEGNEFCLD
jgi:predicted enzyme related to lactoylglutathione lyase